MRPSFDETFLNVAEVISKRATCTRLQVGAVLTQDNRIIATGYNGAPRGLPHCLDNGCDVQDGHCVRCVHAEANALIQAGAAGRATKGATLYTTASPCRHCLNLIINAGVVWVVCRDGYRVSDSLRAAYEASGIPIVIKGDAAW